MGKHIGDRIREAREALGYTQGDLAKKSGITASAVSQWEKGDVKNIKPENLLLIAKALDRNIEYLVHGKGPKHIRSVEAGPELHAVPLISWVQAGRWNEVEDPYRVGDGEKTVYTTRKVGLRAFALRVVGDSMAPDFPEGTIVVVDPDRTAEHGSPVIVRLEDTQEVTFKLLKIDAGRRYLEAINKTYEPIKIDSNATITGVVVQATREL